MGGKSADLFDKAYMRWLIIRLGAGLAVSIFISTILLGWILYAPFHGDYASIFKGLSQVHQRVSMAVIFTGFVQGASSGLAVFICLLFWTHRVAGPVFRLKHSFKQLENGNFRLRIRLRKKDQLQEFATLLNEGIGSTRRSWKELGREVEDLKKELQAQNGEDSAAQPEKILSRLNKMAEIVRRLHG